ncbi:MAG: hypothetical protein U1E14_03735 [Geminicoccaceae bacterium]
MPHPHERHAIDGKQAENQKRQVIARRDFRYWMERRRPRVCIHEATSATPGETGARDCDESHP